MAEKLKGEFLHITEEKEGDFKIEYVGEDGNPYWIRMSTDAMVLRVEGAKKDIERFEQQLRQADSKKREELEALIARAKFEVVWPEMYVAHRKGEDLRRFFEKGSSEHFGVPITKGKYLAKGNHGVVVQFNLRHLHVRTVFRAQLFSSDKQALTEIVSPNQRLTDMFEYLTFPNSPNFAIAQKERSVVAFIKSPPFQLSDSTRIVFWFFRNPIPVEKDSDYVDIPDEYMELAIATTKKLVLQRLEKPIPKDLEETIARETERLKRDANIQNFYVVDTFNLSSEDIERIGEIEETESASKTEEMSRQYAPNLKYQDFHHKRFQELWAEKRSQELAYDQLVKEFPADLSQDGFDNYIVRFRSWNKDRQKKRK